MTRRAVPVQLWNFKESLLFTGNLHFLFHSGEENPPCTPPSFTYVHSHSRPDGTRSPGFPFLSPGLKWTSCKFNLYRTTDTKPDYDFSRNSVLESPSTVLCVRNLILGVLYFWSFKIMSVGLSLEPELS